MLSPHNPRCSARASSRSGFTLVEILVVIAIIALLAGVALPAVTGAIAKAQQNAAVQTSHGIALAAFQYSNDNNGSYPGGSTTSTKNFELMVPTYVGNTDVFFLKGNNRAKFTGTAPSTGLTATNNGWDYTTATTGNAGLSSNDPDSIPLIISTTGATITYPTYSATTPASAAATVAITAPGTAPFGANGVAVAYKDMSSAFCGDVNGAGSAFPISTASLVAGQAYTNTQP